MSKGYTYDPSIFNVDTFWQAQMVIVTAVRREEDQIKSIRYDLALMRDFQFEDLEMIELGMTTFPDGPRGGLKPMVNYRIT